MRMLTGEQLRRYEEDGFVTVATGIDSTLLAEAAATMLRLSPPAPDERAWRTSIGTDNPAILYHSCFRDILQHPSIVGCAREILMAQDVELFQCSPLVAWPQPERDRPQHSYRFHSDTELSAMDFRASPRRLTCEMFIWLVDVPPGRAQLTVHPGSHHENMAYWQAAAGSARIVGHQAADLPTPAKPPTAVEAKAGQVTLLTTALTHSASDNADTSPRVVLNPSYTARSFHMQLPQNQAVQKLQFDEVARRLLDASVAPAQLWRGPAGTAAPERASRL